MAITLTEAAAKKAKELIEEYCFDGLRLGIKGGGCAGFEYIMQGDIEKKDDVVSESHGIKIFCDKKSYLFVNGTEIDYKSEMMYSGFIFKNPQAKNSCGCGNSFSV